MDLAWLRRFCNVWCCRINVRVCLADWELVVEGFDVEVSRLGGRPDLSDVIFGFDLDLDLEGAMMGMSLWFSFHALAPLSN